MAIQLIVAKVLRDELALRGIRSLTAEVSEAIAARIFERIIELELELAARDFNIPRAAATDQRDEPGIMSIYDPLRRELESTREQTVRLTFSEIEDILGRPLPASAYKFSAWWGNERSRKAGHTQAMAWLHAGFAARVSLKQRAVEFHRP